MSELSIDSVNTKVSKATMLGWILGQVWESWNGRTSSLTWIDWAILVIPGTFFTSIVVGGGIAMILGGVTKLLTGSMHSTGVFYAWGIVFSPIAAFFVAKLAVGWLA